jgi:predicted MPP superfamily phosphohydrolase
MSTFLAIYFSIYGGINLFFFWQVRRAFHPGLLLSALLVLFLMLMVLSPVFIRIMEPLDAEWLLRPWAYVTFIWTAIVFWFFALALARDLWNLLARLLSYAVPSAGRLLIPAAAGTVAIFAIISAACLWGLWEASRIRLEEVRVKTARLSPGSPPVRAAVISDLHLGLLCGEGKLKKILSLVREAKPDILFSVGDLVDGTARCLDHFSGLIAGLEAPLGKYAVTGNHEFYAGLEVSLGFAERAGFRVLRGESIMAGDRVRIVGVDDPAAVRVGGEAKGVEDTLLPPEDDRAATILLKHRPKVAAGSPGRFDIQISGHAHGGQIFPFNYLVRLQYPMMDGLYTLEKGSALYVSRGTGTWGPPFRVLSPPEVTLVILEPDQ